MGDYITFVDAVKDANCFSGVGFATNSLEVIESGGLVLGHLYGYYGYIQASLNLASICSQLGLTLADLNIGETELQIVCENNYTSVFKLTDLDFNSISSYNLKEIDGE